MLTGYSHILWSIYYEQIPLFFYCFSSLGLFFTYINAPSLHLSLQNLLGCGGAHLDQHDVLLLFP